MNKNHFMIKIDELYQEIEKVDKEIEATKEKQKASQGSNKILNETILNNTTLHNTSNVTNLNRVMKELEELRQVVSKVVRDDVWS